MSEEDQIKWVELKPDFSPEQEAVLQKGAGQRFVDQMLLPSSSL